MYREDTIAGISTATGEGGIGIVRISGENAIEIAARIFKSHKNKDVKTMKSYTMMYGHIVDPETSEIVDEVILSCMRAPYTYTKEDIIEINCHGGSVAVRRVLAVVLAAGARIAEPGEFTKRAFLNGRIDLSQAEAVIDLIRSKTDEGMKLALSQTQGKLSQKIKDIMEDLVKILSHIGAAVDFPEEDVEEVVTGDIIEISQAIIKKMDSLLINADKGKIIREGLDTIIVGKPNVGKSSLLNALVEESRAIVTDIPGTTRDVIEEYININGIPIRLVDTAGIREAGDIVEKIGIEKSREYIQRAELIIFIIDVSRKIDKEDEDIINLIKDKKTIVVLNKCDLDIKADVDYIRNAFKSSVIVDAVIKSDEGVDQIKSAISDEVYKGNVSLNDVYITNVRHRDIIKRAQMSIKKGLDTLESGIPIDFASIEFKEAYLTLGEITGDTVSDDIIDRIFKDFCVGK